MIRIHSIDCGNLMVDGGSLFGIVPKLEWSKVYQVNEDNMCNLKMRSMLIENGDRLILIDTGIGNKHDSVFLSDYKLNGDGDLIKSLESKGFAVGDITDVIHTHLHFDHCGGTLTKNKKGEIVPTFPNAKLWVSKRQWDSSVNPSLFESGGFLEENIIPMQATGNIKFIENEGELYEGVEVYFADGHSQGQIIPIINYNGVKVMFAADLIPTVVNLNLYSISAYDIYPLKVFSEKRRFLDMILAESGYVFFQHDINIECCTLIIDKGNIVMDRVMNVYDIG